MLSSMKKLNEETAGCAYSTTNESVSSSSSYTPSIYDARDTCVFQGNDSFSQRQQQLVPNEEDFKKDILSHVKLIEESYSITLYEDLGQKIQSLPRFLAGNMPKTAQKDCLFHAILANTHMNAQQKYELLGVATLRLDYVFYKTSILSEIDLLLDLAQREKKFYSLIRSLYIVTYIASEHDKGMDIAVVEIHPGLEKKIWSALIDSNEATPLQIFNLLNRDRKLQFVKFWITSAATTRELKEVYNSLKTTDLGKEVNLFSLFKKMLDLHIIKLAQENQFSTQSLDLKFLQLSRVGFFSCCKPASYETLYRQLQKKMPDASQRLQEEKAEMNNQARRLML